MSGARPWLPAQCLVRDRTAAPFAAVVEEWLGHWFADAGFAIDPQWSAGEGRIGRGTDWMASVAIAPGLDWQERGGASGAVADALIPDAARRPTVSPMDQELLGALGRAILDDLRARLSHIAPERGEASPAAAKNGVFHLALRDPAGRPILRLIGDEGLLVPLAKRDVAAARPLPPLAGPDEAIAGIEVEASALAGRVRLSYAELRELSAGDVLILDSSYEAPLDLLVGGAVAAPAFVAGKPGAFSPPSAA